MELVFALMRRARSYMSLASRADDAARHSEMLELAACCLEAAAQGLRRGKQGPALYSSVAPRRSAASSARR